MLGTSASSTAVGVIALIVGATTVFSELQSSLDRIWQSPAAEKKEGIWNLLRSRVLSFGMILAIGFLLLISLVLSAGLAAVGAWWAPAFGGWKILLQVVNLLVSFVVVTALFALIYKYLPRAKIGWRDVCIGAAATSLLFTLGQFLVGLYIGKRSAASGFGAAGSLVVVLVWVYYSAQIFLLGAELVFKCKATIFCSKAARCQGYRRLQRYAMSNLVQTVKATGRIGVVGMPKAYKNFDHRKDGWTRMVLKPGK